MHAPLRTACSGSSAGRAAYKTLAGPDTVWDDNRGTGLPGNLMPDPTDIDALDNGVPPRVLSVKGVATLATPNVSMI